MFIDVVKTLESFKNPVIDVHFKNGTTKLGCDIGAGGDSDKVIIVEGDKFIIYHFSEVSSVHYYDKDSQ